MGILFLHEVGGRAGHEHTGEAQEPVETQHVPRGYRRNA
jgi:hypothetical protein